MEEPRGPTIETYGVGVTDWLVELVVPSSPVTVSVTVTGVPSAYVWLTTVPVPTKPSPKFQD
jgi:hypothetical protein